MFLHMCLHHLYVPGTEQSSSTLSMTRLYSYLIASYIKVYQVRYVRKYLSFIYQCQTTMLYQLLHLVVTIVRTLRLHYILSLVAFYDYCVDNDDDDDDEYHDDK